MTSASAPAVGRRWELLLIVLPALVLFTCCAFDQNLFNDGDTNWHVAVGRWMLAHRAVPHTDLFSYTFAGRHWVPLEWGSEGLMGLAFAAAGWNGVTLLFSAAMAATAAIIAAWLRRWLGTLSVIVGVALFSMMQIQHLLARPHILALVPLAAWLVGLMEARRAGRAPSPWLLPVMVVWANLHGSFTLGLAVIGPFALEAFLDAPGRRLRVALAWGGFLSGAILAALITPDGLEGLIFPFALMLMSGLGAVGEWQPFNAQHATPFEFALLFTLFICLYRGVKVGAVRLGVLFVLLHLAMAHVRHESVLGVAGPLLLAEPLGRAFEPQAQPTGAPRPWASLARLAAPALAMAVLFVAVAAGRLALPIRRVDSEYVPVSALAHVPPGLAVQPVFNDYAFGGWLIFNGVRPYIDGRTDMYGDAFVHDYVAIERAASPEASAAALSRNHVAWTILMPASPLVAQLDRTPGWRRLYADRWAVVQARQAAEGTSLPKSH